MLNTKWITYWICVVVLLTTTPVCFAASPTFDTYQRVKNITAGDPSSGNTVTLGRPDDELHHLVFVYNTDNREHTYTVTALLPNWLTLDSGTTERRTDNGWEKTTGVDTGYVVHLRPFEHVYHRFTTHVARELPNENLILVTAVSVTDEGGSQKTSSTKIYVPYFDSTRALSKNYTKTDTTDEAAIKQALDEERAFMEAEFAKLIANETHPQNTPTSSTPEPVRTNQDLAYYVIIFGVLITLFTLYHLFHHDHRKK